MNQSCIHIYIYISDPSCYVFAAVVWSLHHYVLLWCKVYIIEAQDSKNDILVISEIITNISVFYHLFIFSWKDLIPGMQPANPKWALFIMDRILLYLSSQNIVKDNFCFIVKKSYQLTCWAWCALYSFHVKLIKMFNSGFGIRIITYLCHDLSLKFVLGQIFELVESVGEKSMI